MLIVSFFCLSLLVWSQKINYDRIVMYPNPCHDYLNVKSDTLLPAILEIYTFEGKLVMIKKIEEGQMEVRIDVTTLKPGSYIITFKNK